MGEDGRWVQGPRFLGVTDCELSSQEAKDELILLSDCRQAVVLAKDRGAGKAEDIRTAL